MEKKWYLIYTTDGGLINEESSRMEVISGVYSFDNSVYSKEYVKRVVIFGSEKELLDYVSMSAKKGRTPREDIVGFLGWLSGLKLICEQDGEKYYFDSVLGEKPSADLIKGSRLWDYYITH